MPAPAPAPSPASASVWINPALITAFALPSRSLLLPPSNALCVSLLRPPSALCVISLLCSVDHSSLRWRFCLLLCPHTPSGDRMAKPFATRLFCRTLRCVGRDVCEGRDLKHDDSVAISALEGRQCCQSLLWTLRNEGGVQGGPTRQHLWRSRQRSTPSMPRGHT